MVSYTGCTGSGGVEKQNQFCVSNSHVYSTVLQYLSINRLIVTLSPCRIQGMTVSLALPNLSAFSVLY